MNSDISASKWTYAGLFLVTLATLMFEMEAGMRVTVTDTPVACARARGAVRVMPVPDAPDVPTAETTADSMFAPVSIEIV